MKFWAVLAVFAPWRRYMGRRAETCRRATRQTAVQQPLQADEPTRIQVDVTRVNMLYTVTDRRFVTNLTKDDFEVIDSKKPQSILEFSAETDLPLRLGILIDTSNSIRDRFSSSRTPPSSSLTTPSTPIRTAPCW
jgi:hypothetical protein